MENVINTAEIPCPLHCKNILGFFHNAYGGFVPVGAFAYRTEFIFRKVVTEGATVDFRTDMYALGKIMEEMHGPKRFDYIIHKCCAENPDRRYSSFDALRADLLKEVNRYRMRKHTKIAFC